MGLSLHWVEICLGNFANQSPSASMVRRSLSVWCSTGCSIGEFARYLGTQRWNSRMPKEDDEDLPPFVSEPLQPTLSSILIAVCETPLSVGRTLGDTVRRLRPARMRSHCRRKEIEPIVPQKKSSWRIYCRAHFS